MQNLVDKLSLHLFGAGEPQRVETRYVDGSSLSIDVRFLQKDDHELENLFIKKLPILCSIPRDGDGGRKLIKHVAEGVLTDRPGIIPMAIKETFETMLNAEL